MIAEPECHKRQCKHFIGVKTDGDPEVNERVVCRAFPDGIPAKVAYGPVLHTISLPGDRGIRFEKGESE